jgi:hypothetical protein
MKSSQSGVEVARPAPIVDERLRGARDWVVYLFGRSARDSGATVRLVGWLAAGHSR